MMFDVFLDKGQDVWDDIVLAARGQQHETHTRSLTRVPVIIIVVLILQENTSNCTHQLINLPKPSVFKPPAAMDKTTHTREVPVW